ncbi:hypothetical protein CI109_106015 [Kwoniella shandongensis]|uniref:Large ribosomal subunit protein mL54 n=1 Tax=Kwoniella shandongensis TaxID=1734106 RepID=A0A5M6BXV1_9TREE|nr:uncharacterized protein CI109_003936 [Kwoniella shandongensis]KAA5527677.1 hypothetical protein CI109_003936 [Kwoniella shandongensis]
MSLATIVSRSASRRLTQTARIGVASFSSSSSSSSSSPASSSTPKPKKVKTAKALSSCLPGTTLTGLSILKDKPDPVALPDDQYPTWLWTLLDDTSKAHKAVENEVHLSQEGQQGFDVVKEKRKLKNLNREKIKASNYLKSTT